MCLPPFTFDNARGFSHLSSKLNDVFVLIKLVDNFLTNLPKTNMITVLTRTKSAPCLKVAIVGAQELVFIIVLKICKYQYLLFLLRHKQKQIRMNYSKYSRAAEGEKGRSNKTFYVITCTKCRKRMVERIKHGYNTFKK